MPTGEVNREWLTHKRRIDPQMHAAGCPKGQASYCCDHRVEEHEKNTSSAGSLHPSMTVILSVVETKELSLGPQNVLRQAAHRRHSSGFNAPLMSLARED